MPTFPRSFSASATHVLYGTSAVDAFAGGTGFDLVSYERATAAVTLDLVAPALNTGFAKGDTFSSIEMFSGSAFGDTMRGDAGNNIFLGEGGNDRLFGFGGNDSLYGMSGNDVLDGGEGWDRLSGGAGADRLIGGNGFDYADYWDATERVVVNLMTPSVNRGEAAGDTYLSIEGVYGSDFNDDITGDAADNAILSFEGDDWVYGRDGNDTIMAWSGNDRLEGGKGNDLMFGSGGADTFFFYLSDLAPGSRDRIADFDSTDKIVLQGVTMNSISYVADFIGGPLKEMVIDLGNGGSAVIEIQGQNINFSRLPPELLLLV